jgi:threonine/homoserine/homoserine lactone efflux protein
MIQDVNLPLILLAALIGVAPPGPATLAIAAASMEHGRRSGLAVATGTLTASLVWSIAAAFGLGALMLANAWVFEIARYLGAAYLLFLGLQAGRSAIQGRKITVQIRSKISIRRSFMNGLSIHLTNPKALLAFGSIYAIGIPASTSANILLLVIAAMGAQSAVVFVGYAFLFSIDWLTVRYFRLQRWLDGAVSVVFLGAGTGTLLYRS